jgi:hypothetical protein
VRGQAGDGIAVEQHTAVAWLHQAHDGLERGRLADAVPAEQAHHFAPLHVERDAVQDVALAVIGMHILDQDDRLGAGRGLAHVLR